jgi:hypothetical protein
METKFTQKVSMKCTKEQYEEFLKDELLKMGYKEDEENLSNWGYDDAENNNYISINVFVCGEILQRPLESALANIPEGHSFIRYFDPSRFLYLAKIKANYPSESEPTCDVRYYYHNGAITELEAIEFLKGRGYVITKQF